MRVKINSYIVGMSQKPGSILHVGQDITEEDAARLLSMGKEAELVPEDPAEEKSPGSPQDTTDASSPQGPWFGMPGAAQQGTGSPLDGGSDGSEATASGKQGKRSKAAP
jgi:hypothetical protein